MNHNEMIEEDEFVLFYSRFAEWAAAEVARLRADADAERAAAQRASRSGEQLCSHDPTR